MKKPLLFTAILALAMAVSLPATAQEVNYVVDCQQGLLLNPNRDNWFITARGGANFSFGQYDMKAPFKDRIGANAALLVGKWLTPTFGLRFGFNMSMSKGATLANGTYVDQAHGPFSNGFYPKKYYGMGVEVDGLINMTNWIMGYRPGRIYNAVVHGGFGSMWCLRHSDDDNGYKWKYDFHNRVFYMNLGLQNNFNIGKGFEVFVDVEGQINDFPRVDYIVNLTAGLTYNFPSRKWNCPVTAVCPTWKYTDQEGDALTAQLTAAENRINELQSQLDSRPNRGNGNSTVSNYSSDCGLATIYYPINQYSLGTREKVILKALANVIKANPDTQYQLTGWADNYTGNEDINVNLRNNRVNGVYNYLVSLGVNKDQLKTDIDNNNLTDYGISGASLDRAVTIREIK